MKTSEDLFILVKSLSKSEKAYFKKNSAFHTLGDENKYVMLFDIVDSMKSYNEKKIIENFSGDRFVNQISVAKNYLYNSILKSLKSYRRTVSKRDEVKHLLEDISVLFDKRIFNQARKLLRRCRKLTENYEMFSEMMQILIWELKIVVTEKTYEKKTDEIINSNYEGRKIILGKINNLYEYDRIEYNIVSALTQGSDKKKSELKKNLNNIISNSLLDDESKALSLSAKMKFNHIHASYHYASGNLNESYKYLHREVELLENSKAMLEEKFNDYLILLSNLLVISLELHRYADFQNQLKKFRNNLDNPLVVKSEKLKFYITNNSYMLELSFLKRTGEFEKVIEVNELFASKLSELKSEIVKTDFYLLNNILSQAHLGLGNYDEAVNYLLNILNDKEAEARFADFQYSKIYLMIVHYELNNFDYLEYLIKSTYYYFLKSGSMGKFERTIFRFLRKLTNVTEEKGLKNAFSELKEVLLNIKEEPSVKNALKYFDFISWLESKIEKRSFAELVKEKMSN